MGHYVSNPKNYIRPQKKQKSYLETTMTGYRKRKKGAITSTKLCTKISPNILDKFVQFTMCNSDTHNFQARLSGNRCSMGILFYFYAILRLHSAFRKITLGISEKALLFFWGVGSVFFFFKFAVYSPSVYIIILITLSKADNANVHSMFQAEWLIALLAAISCLRLPAHMAIFSSAADVR